jgi:hypothetical protein
MLLDRIFKPFVEKRPFCVMVRAALERMLSPPRLDQLFRDQAEREFPRENAVASEGPSGENRSGNRR